MEKIKLSVATSWDDNLLNEISKRKIKIYEVFGSLPKSIIGSGRETKALPQIEISQALNHIKLAHKLGIKFNYLINASCLSNIEHSREGRKKIYKYLEFIIEELKVDSVTVTLPFLIELIKKEFPQTEIVVSTINHIKSIQEIKFYEDLGADRITLSYMINRNFSLLKRIINSTYCKIEILVNESCLFHCPFRNYHYNLVSHASQQQIDIIQYPFLNCTRIKLRRPIELIKARWVRPEDTEKYEDIGISFFKLAGREKNTEWILKTTEAYFQRRYKGNLLDIIAIVLLPTDQFGLEVSQKVNPPLIYLDNQKLDNFLSFFIKKGNKCDEECNKCHYCSKIAKETIFYDKNQVEIYLQELETLHLKFFENFKTLRQQV